MEHDDADAAQGTDARRSGAPDQDGNALERGGRSETATAGLKRATEAAQQAPLDRDAYHAGARDAPDDAPGLVPAALARRYVRIENRYYFRDPGHAFAFEDQGERIATAHHHPEVARAMVELAAAKGWHAVVVRGSDAFKREAWLQARLHGMTVEGFRPRGVDLSRLDATQVQRPSPQHTHARTADAQTKPADTRPDDRGAADDPPHSPRHEAALEALATILRHRGDSVEQVVAATDLARQWFQTEHLYRGRIIEAGRAAYGFDPSNKPSHFVRLALPQGGTETVWGRDLERALAASGAGSGDGVVLAGYVMREPAGPRAASGSVGPMSDRARNIAERTIWTVTPTDRQRAPLTSAERARASDRAATVAALGASRSVATPRPDARTRDGPGRSR